MLDYQGLVLRIPSFFYDHDPNVYMDRILKPSSKPHICTSKLFHKWIMIFGEVNFPMNFETQVPNYQYHIYIYYMDCNPYHQILPGTLW